LAAAGDSWEPRAFLEANTGSLTILVLGTLILGSLLILTPQLLRAHLRLQEMQHLERLKTLEHGHSPLPTDDRSQAAGRVALLVPSVVIISAATVTCFLVAYHTDNLFAVSLAIWCVAGVVSLAAITGGVALLGRLAQLSVGEVDDELVDEEERLPRDFVEK
jgi:hypothetical protein